MAENVQKAIETQGVTVEFPVAEVGEDRYISRRLDLSLTHRQARALTAITEALDAEGARLDNEKRCIRHPDTIRWMLERVAERL